MFMCASACSLLSLFSISIFVSIYLFVCVCLEHKYRCCDDKINGTYVACELALSFISSHYYDYHKRLIYILIEKKAHERLTVLFTPKSIKATNSISFEFDAFFMQV